LRLRSEKSRGRPESSRVSVHVIRCASDRSLRCEVSGKRVLPRELESSAATRKRALKEFFVSSSISGARFLQGEGIVSAVGKYCLEKEAKVCTWSSRKCHPDDLRTCELTRLAAHFEYMTNNGGMRLEPLLNLLNGLRRESDKSNSILMNRYLRQSAQPTIAHANHTTRPPTVEGVARTLVATLLVMTA